MSFRQDWLGCVMEQAEAPVENYRVQEEFTCLLSDPELVLNARGRRLLTYLMDARFRGDKLVDPRAIAIDVLGRRADFTPSMDPIVRIEMTRLRAALNNHYKTRPGSPVRIIIPHRTYIPIVEFRENLDPSAPSQPPTMRSIETPAARTISATPLVKKALSAIEIGGAILVMFLGVALAIRILLL